MIHYYYFINFLCFFFDLFLFFCFFFFFSSRRRHTRCGRDWSSDVCSSDLEYFERLGEDPAKWGKPFAALLGAYYVQTELGIPAVGGKDSMSGSFEDLHVPPTVVAVAVCPADARRILSPRSEEHTSELQSRPHLVCR